MPLDLATSTGTFSTILGSILAIKEGYEMKPSLDWQLTQVDPVTLYYYPEENYFVDEDMGAIVYDIFRFISPNMLTLFKLKKEPMYIPDEEHQIVYELLYPNEDEEDC